MKQYSRFMAFILATAVTLAVSVGVLAYDDHLAQTMPLYGSEIMPLAVSSYTLVGSVANLTHTAGFNNNITSVTSSTYGTSVNVTNPASSFTDKWSGSITSVTYSIPSPGVPSSGALHLSGKVGYFIYLGTDSLYTRRSSSVANAYYGSSRAVYPSSLSILFDGVEVVNVPSSGNSFYVDFDVLIPVSAPVSSILFRLNYSGTISYSVSYTLSSTSTNLVIGNVYDFYFGSSGPTLFSRFASGYIGGSNSLEVEFIEDTPDYTDILYRIYNAITSLSGQLGELSPMQQFENNYLENFGDQIDKTEQAMSPSNPALPNGGDIGGFVDDISSGLGLSGSSFSASDFSDATSAFSGTESTGAGGPWEFFTQGVADDLSGDNPTPIDDDYSPILAWFEEAERRYVQWWGSSSP